MRHPSPILVLAALLLGVPVAAQTVNDPNVTVSAVVPTGSLALPTQIRFIGPNDFLVTEKNTGRVRRVQNGAVSATIVLDLNVSTENERGLLGLEFHPNFASRGSPGTGARSDPRSCS